jgi:hypothetical protein
MERANDPKEGSAPSRGETPDETKRSVPKQGKGQNGRHDGKKEITTFLSHDAAARIVRKSLDIAATILRRTGEVVVDGWRSRLGNHFIRLTRGSFDQHRSGTWPGLTFQQVAKKTMAIVLAGQLRTGQLYGSPRIAGELVAVEEHQAEKIGPRGCFQPWPLWGDEKVQKVWTPKKPGPKFNEEALRLALLDLQNAHPQGVIDVDESSIHEGLKTSSSAEDSDLSSLDTTTNSGFGSWVKGWFHRVWDSTVTVYQRAVQVILVNQARSTWKKLLNIATWKEGAAILHFTSVANQRTNVSAGYKPTAENTYRGKLISKQRVVQAMPKLDTLIAKPFINRLIKATTEHLVNTDGSHVFCALTTPERIAKNMQQILATAAKHNLTVLSTDFSGFDETIPAWLAFRTAEAVSHWMTPRAGKIWLSLIYAEFYHTSCLTPSRYFPEGESSMKSGTGPTNMMDSLINYVSQRYGLHAGYYKSILCQAVQGDDAVLLGDGITPESFEACVADLGFVGNASKQFYQPNMLSFCQLTHVLGYPGGIYPIARAAASLVSTEDDVRMETDYPGQFKYVLAYRNCCRLDTACFNPNFVEFVNFVKAGDSIHLGAEVPASELARLAGSYATKYEMEWKTTKPWKSPGQRNAGFDRRPVNRVLRGELPPPPGVKLFEWVYGVRYEEVAL